MPASIPICTNGETQATAPVLATPQVYVFDAARKLRYVGRFDDSDVKTVKSHDTRNAIDELLAGKPVTVEKTRVFGCSTKWADKRGDAAKALAKQDAEPVTIETIDDAAVASLAKNEGKKLLMVNLWATWCGPCVSELPEFVTMNRMYRKRNFQLVTISLDEPDKKDDALKVLTENHVSATNYILNTKDRDTFAEALDKEWPGPIPYTLLIAPGGKVIYRKTGAIDPLDVKRAIVKCTGQCRGPAHFAPATSDDNLGAASNGAVTGSTTLLSWTSVPPVPTKKLWPSATCRLNTGWT